MSVPMPNDNQPSQFNDVLERCIRGVESGQVTLEECVTRFPQYPELGDLLRLATEFSALPRPEMSAAFTAQTQRQLHANLRATMRKNKAARSAYRWQPLYRVLAAVLVFGLVIFVGGAGLVRAADSALPGDTLYGVKRSVEQTELYFAPVASRPDLLTHIAEVRLSEIATLTERGQRFSEPFITDMLDGVNVALVAQPNEIARTRLLTEAVNTVQRAQNQGGLTADLASRTLVKLEVTGNVTVLNGPTPGVVAQAVTPSLTPTATATVVLSVKPSVGPSIAPSATAILPTEPNATFLPTFTPSLTRTIPTKPPTFTPSSTRTASPTRTPTSNASPTLGQGQAVIITGIPTIAPVRPTSAPAVQGPKPTTAPDSSAGVPKPNNLPPITLKQPWKQSTVNNCPPEGQGGDPLLNQTRNRIDDGSFQPTAFDNVAKLTWPKDAEGKPHDQWSSAAKDEIGRSEGLPLSIEAYLVKVQENGPEAQNCNADKTWQLWILGTPGSGGDLNRALIAEITPRIRPNHAGWTLDKLTVLAAAGAKVRINGWLAFNPERAGDVGKTRASLWEIHPTIQIAVWKNDQWVSLDDYQ